MNKLKLTSFLIIISLVFVQCTKEDPFLIQKNSVGKISNTDLVSDIETIFAGDSIVKHLSEGALGGKDTRFRQDNDAYLIYSKEGKHLLTLVPKISQDSTSTIKYVEIMGYQFKTGKGLSLKMPFKEINFNYLINKVETSLSSATLYIDELNATIALDKIDLGLDPFYLDEVKVEQIPDLAKIKTLTIWFD